MREKREENTGVRAIEIVTNNDIMEDTEDKVIAEEDTKTKMTTEEETKCKKKTKKTEIKPKKLVDTEFARRIAHQAQQDLDISR